MRTDLLLPFPFNLSGRLQWERPTTSSNRWEENESGYILTALAAGLGEDNIDLQSSNQKLSLKMEGSNGFGHVSHQHQWTLPEDADVSNIEASLSRGVLTVVVPRAQKKDASRIAIKNLDQTFEQTQQNEHQVQNGSEQSL